MALYVHPENQQLLWDIMNKIQVVNEFFLPHSSSQKEQWFKSVIQMFYDRYKNHKLQINDLHKLNQETITYIMTTIRDRVEHSQKKQPEIERYSQVQQPTITKEQRVENKQEFYSQQFQERQNEYKTMFEKQAPSEINFRDKIEDTAISNMEELMRIHKQQRDVELQQYAPPPPNLKIEPTTVNITAEIIETDEQKMKKSVSWNDNNNNNMQIMDYEDRFKKQVEEITYLKSVVTSLSGTIETLCKEMIHIKRHVDVSAGDQFILDQHGVGGTEWSPPNPPPSFP